MQLSIFDLDCKTNKMLLIRTKNTFINVVDPVDPSPYPESRNRTYSCPPCLDGYCSEADSLSTAPTSNSPIQDTGTPSANVAKPVHTTVKLSNLPSNMSKNMLIGVLASLGFRITPSSIKFTQGSTSGLAMEAAHIRLPSADLAMRLFHLMHGEKIAEEEVHATVSTEPTDRYEPVTLLRKVLSRGMTRRKRLQHSKKVFIGGLSPLTDAKSIRNYFSNFGAIKDCGIVKDFYGVSRRFGFCEFWSDVAVAELLEKYEHVVDDHVIGVRPYCLRE